MTYELGVKESKAHMTVGPDWLKVHYMETVYQCMLHMTHGRLDTVQNVLFLRIFPTAKCKVGKNFFRDGSL